MRACAGQCKNRFTTQWLTNVETYGPVWHFTLHDAATCPDRKMLRLRHTIRKIRGKVVKRPADEYIEQYGLDPALAPDWQKDMIEAAMSGEEITLSLGGSENREVPDGR